MDASSITFLLAATLAFAAPVVFTAMGELISEKAGVINIQLEGMMLVGAFCGVWGSLVTGSLVIGFIAAAAGGASVALVHGVLCFICDAEQVVSGVVLNILALGLTSFAMAPVFGSNLGQSAPTLQPFAIPYLADIPFIGRAFFQQTLTVYLALGLVVLVWWFLNRTTMGLALQAAGEAPTAARSMGVSVGLVRWSALMVCGILSGIGGGQLVLAGLGSFTQNVTAGRGFVALAAVIFGRWKPAGALLAVFVFTAVEAIQVRAQVWGVRLPYQFLVMAPYVVTILALAIFIGRSRPPRSLGTNKVGNH